MLNSEHILPQIALRLWPFPRGSGRIVDRVFSRLVFREKLAFVRTTDGFGLHIRPNELIGRHIYLTGEFDRTTVEVLCKLACPGDTLLDIGANIGYVSACFLANVPSSQAIAVEPQPSVYELLGKNLSQFSNCATCFPVAISDRAGSGRLEVCPGNSGAGHLTNDGGSSAISVTLWTPDQLMARITSRIDLIKIDVEGHEQAVISAFSPIIPILRPRAIIFADHTASAAPDGPIGRVLAEHGYMIYGIRKRLTRVNAVPISVAEQCKFNDYVAVQSEMPMPQAWLP